MDPESGPLPCSIGTMPEWVPQPALRYLLHTEAGLSIRSLAREAGCHASTVLRQVRRLESKRDDLLIDEALRELGAAHFQMSASNFERDGQTMTAAIRRTSTARDDGIEHEACRILRRLNENGSVLAVAQELKKAVVIRDLPGGKSTRTAVVDREIAQAMALKDWIICRKGGKVARYVITPAGQAALKRLIGQQGSGQSGLHDAQAIFGDQHRIWGHRQIASGDDGPERQIRYNVAESPLAALARRKDRNGNLFLNDDLVTAGERLREDFELAQMGPRVAQNWEKFLTGGVRGGRRSENRLLDGPGSARERVSDALRALGPGLGDVALRCCCYLESMEAAERRMGWSARSGKVVLRIALQRLRDHYERTHGRYGPLIG